MAQHGLPIAAAILMAALAMAASTPGRAAETTGAWRLLRTPNPLGGADAVSITHTADTARSDPDFVGLMLRCTQSGPQAVVILIVPLPPRAQPHVTLGAGGDRVVRVDATIGTPGSIVVLPSPAAAALMGPWRSLDEVSIEVDTQGEVVRGVVALAGLDQAARMLNVNCLAQP